MDIQTILTQPDKTVITTPVLGVLKKTYPLEQTSHPTYGDGTKQGAILQQGALEIRVEFRDQEDISRFQGQQVKLTHTQTEQYGPKGLAVNRYYSQAKGQEMVSLRVTSTGNIEGSGGQQAAPPTQTPPPAQQAPQGQTYAAPAPSTQPHQVRPAGQAVGAALNNATHLLIAEGITNPTERQLWEKASIYLVVAAELEAGKVNRPAPKQMPAAAPPQQAPAQTPPPQQLPPQPSDQDVLDEDVPF